MLMNLLPLESKIKETVIELENELKNISRFNYSDYQRHVLNKKIAMLNGFLNQLKE